MKTSKLKRRLLIAAVIGSLLLPSTAKANDPVKECVAKCDAALADQDKVINLKIRQIDAQKEVIDEQDKRIAQLEKEKSGLFSSPWFYFGIGVVAGALIVRGK